MVHGAKFLDQPRQQLFALTLPLNVVTLSLKQRDRRTSILWMGPSTATFATSSKNSLRRILKSWRTQRRPLGSLQPRGCSGIIIISSTCSSRECVRVSLSKACPTDAGAGFHYWLHTIHGCTCKDVMMPSSASRSI